jgi:hypothetical protein
MEQKHKLIELLNYLQIEYDFNLVDMALVFFRKSYQERPYKYPGDNELYCIVQRCLLQGNDFKQSIDFTFEIIKREINIYDCYTAMARQYSENFYPPQKEFKIDLNSAKNFVKTMNIKLKWYQKIPIIRNIVWLFYEIRYRLFNCL